MNIREILFIIFSPLTSLPRYNTPAGPLILAISDVANCITPFRYTDRSSWYTARDMWYHTLVTILVDGMLSSEATVLVRGR